MFPILASTDWLSVCFIITLDTLQITFADLHRLVHGYLSKLSVSSFVILCFLAKLVCRRKIKANYHIGASIVLA